MGGGPTKRKETKRKIPAPLRDGGEGDGLAADNGGGEPDFCELRQTVDFEATEPSRITVGMRVRLLPQHLPQVMAGSRVVGFVPEPDASAMRNCLEEGFLMGGSVRNFDATRRRGQLSVRGVSGGR
jgi:hypothetical protein